MEDRKLLSGTYPILDTNFGSGAGYIIQNANPKMAIEIASAVAVQPKDQKIVWGGAGYLQGSPSDFLVYRCNSGGSPDTSFGTGGRVSVYFGGSGGQQYFSQILIDPTTGKILLVGRVAGDKGSAVTGLARLNSNGSLDTSFGKGGKVTFSAFTPRQFWNVTSTPKGVAVDASGSIVVAGGSSSADNKGNYSYCNWILRYTTSGALDTSFNKSGEVIGPITNSQPLDGWSDLRLETATAGSHNAIDVVGYNAGLPVLEHVDSSGKISTPVTQAVPTGLNLTGGGEFQATGQSAGQVVHAQVASSSDSVMLYRDNADGTLDTTGFATTTGNVATVNFSTYFTTHASDYGLPTATYKAVIGMGWGNASIPVIDPATSSIVLCVTAEVSDASTGTKLQDYAMIVRLLGDGTPDPNFGIAGVSATAFVPGSVRQSFQSVLVQPASGTNPGTILAVGFMQPYAAPANNDQVMLMARYSIGDPPGRSGHRATPADATVVDAAPALVQGPLSSARIEASPAGSAQATLADTARLRQRLVPHLIRPRTWLTSVDRNGSRFFADW